MRMDSKDVLYYPNFADYVQNSLPSVGHVHTIVANMKTYGSLKKSDFQHALMWGTDPLIVIRDLGGFLCGKAKATGCFDPARPDRIELNRETVATFEADKLGLGSGSNSAGQRVFVIGATILHELCHWGNNRAGRAETREMGEAFEKATYGAIIGSPTIIVFP